MTNYKLHTLNRNFVWKDAAPVTSRRLTPDELTQFNEQGFVRLKNVFTPTEIARVTAAIDPLERAEEERLRQIGGQEFISEADSITFTIYLVRHSQVLRTFAAHPAIKDICHDLIGDDVRLYWDQSVYKKSAKPQEFPWHQDNGYTFIEPQQYLTLWIPLVNADENNGCPWLAPGLHRKGTFEHRKSPIGLVCFDKADDAVCVPADAGDVVAFSSLAPHRTGPNLKAGTVRKTYILQYAPEGAYMIANGTRTLQNDETRQFKILDGGR